MPAMLANKAKDISLLAFIFFVSVCSLPTTDDKDGMESQWLLKRRTMLEEHTRIHQVALPVLFGM